MAKQNDLKTVEVLFDLGAHLGHKKSRLHPKARKNVYKILNKTSIIDLTKTVDQLEKAKKYISESAKEGKSILVVGTKKTASTFVKSYCSTNSVAYVSSKWLPGLLTNFKMIMKNVKKLHEYREQVANEEKSPLVKHERTKIKKEITKLERLFSGLELLKEKPDFMLIIDIRKEKNALKEAQEFHIPVVAMADTNADPDTVSYPVVANDDDSQVVEYLLKELLEPYIKNFTPKVITK